MEKSLVCMCSGQHNMEANQEEKNFFGIYVLGEQLLLEWMGTILEYDSVLLINPWLQANGKLV